MALKELITLRKKAFESIMEKEEEVFTNIFSYFHNDFYTSALKLRVVYRFSSVHPSVNYVPLHFI